MTNEVASRVLSLEDLMEFARSHALVDGWTLDGEIVELTVGTYKITLRRQAAAIFVGGLLRNYEHALEQAAD